MTFMRSVGDNAIRICNTFFSTGNIQHSAPRLTSSDHCIGARATGISAYTHTIRTMTSSTSADRHAMYHTWGHTAGGTMAEHRGMQTEQPHSADQGQYTPVCGTTTATGTAGHHTKDPQPHATLYKGGLIIKDRQRHKAAHGRQAATATGVRQQGEDGYTTARAAHVQQ